VPTGSYPWYRSTPVWGDFLNTIEEDITKIKPASADLISIASGNGIVTVQTKEATLISIYILSGQLIYENTINKDTQIPLNDGLYIVNVGGKTTKWMVN